MRLNARAKCLFQFKKLKNIRIGPSQWSWLRWPVASWRGLLGLDPEGETAGPREGEAAASLALLAAAAAAVKPREGLENEDWHTRGKPKDGQDEKQQTNIECRQSHCDI